MLKKPVFKVIVYLITLNNYSCNSQKSNTFLAEIGVCTSVSNADMLAKYGYAYIEEGVSRFLMPTKSEEVFNEVLQQALNAPIPIKVCNSFIPKNMKSVGTEAVHPEILEYMEIAFLRAQKAGVKYIVFGSGGSRAIPDGFSHDEALRQFIDLCSQMAPIAARYDVVVVLEPLNSKECNFINTVTEGGKIVEEVNHPNFRLLADFYHMLMNGEEPESIEKYGHLIQHTHLAEKDERAAPGSHNEDFTAYFKALKNVGYKGKISIECKWESLETQAPTAIKAIRNQLSTQK
ncbi:MAG: sugar phosphate isomerase/epimerase [Bacteroidales bacterium]|nr:sugar phosphate isomerase/epimerase [Bacteroidales bacterium]MCF8389584.1 sugar phosphate isomerase/epimerase [Bacteroidales bacterium]